MTRLAAAWSVLTGEYAAGVPALVNGPAALLILRRLHRSQRSVARVTRVPPCEPILPVQPQPSCQSAPARSSCPATLAQPHVPIYAVHIR
jgi:hypothetical protein